MPVIEYQGATHEFPDSATEDEIRGALESYAPKVKRIEFNGRLHEFPSDATDDQIRVALGGVSNPSTISPEYTQRMIRDRTVTPDVRKQYLQREQDLARQEGEDVQTYDTLGSKAGYLVHGIGNVAKGAVYDTAAAMSGQGYDQSHNVYSALKGEPMPLDEKLEGATGLPKFAADVSQGISHMLPQLAVSGGVAGLLGRAGGVMTTAAGQPSTVAHMAAAGGVFGFDESGFNPQAAATMALFPVAGKVGSGLMLKSLEKVGVPVASESAKAAWATTGALLGTQAYMDALNTPVYLDPNVSREEKLHTFANGLAMNLGFVIHGKLREAGQRFDKRVVDQAAKEAAADVVREMRPEDIAEITKNPNLDIGDGRTMEVPQEPPSPISAFGPVPMPIEPKVAPAPKVEQYVKTAQNEAVKNESLAQKAEIKRQEMQDEYDHAVRMAELNRLETAARNEAPPKLPTAKAVLETVKLPRLTPEELIAENNAGAKAAHEAYLQEARDLAALDVKAVEPQIGQPQPARMDPTTNPQEISNPLVIEPSLMTPKEFGLQVYGSPTGYIKEAFVTRKPVNAALLKQQQIEATKREPALDLPSGYVLEGDRYVFNQQSTKPSIPAPELKAKPSTIKSQADAFDSLLIEHGIPNGWFQDYTKVKMTPRVRAQDQKGGDVQQNLMHAKQMKLAREFIARELGIKNFQASSMKDRADALPKLREYIAQMERAKAEEETHRTDESDLQDVPIEFVPEETQPKLLKGESQGDLISSTQREDLSLVKEKGVDYDRLSKELDAAKKVVEEARQLQEKQQQNLFKKTPPTAESQPSRVTISSEYSENQRDVFRKIHEGLSTFSIPKPLAGAKPRYAYGPNQFQVDFVSDVDKAAYIAQSRSGARSADYNGLLAEIGGEYLGDTIGKLVKKRLNEMAKDADIESLPKRGGVPVLRLEPIGIPEFLRRSTKTASRTFSEPITKEPSNVEDVLVNKKQDIKPPETPLQTINRASQVRLTVPEGATFILGTDTKGRRSIVPLENFKKGNPFRGADIVTVEAGTIGKDKAFKVFKEGEVGVVEKPSPQKEIHPMGASMESEHFQTTGTPIGIKISAIDAQRAARGQEPLSTAGRRSFGKVWDSTLALVNEDPTHPKALVDSYLQDQAEGVRQSLTDDKVAMLMYRNAELSYQRARQMREMHLALEDKRMDDYARLKADAAELATQIDNLEHVISPLKSETARGLAALRHMVGDNYTLEAMKFAKQKDLGMRELSSEEIKAVEKAHAEIQQKLDLAEKKIAELEADKARNAEESKVKQVEKEVERQDKEDAEIARKTGQRETRDIPAEQDAIREGMKEAYNEGMSLPELSGYLQKLAENLWRDGIREMEPLLDEMHRIVKFDIDPTITRSELSDAFTGRGKSWKPNQEAVKVGVRDLKAQARIAENIKRVIAGLPVEATGMLRDVPSDAQRRLTKIFNEAKKKFGLVVVDPAKALKSALDALHTRQRNRIRDLKFENATRKKIVKDKTNLTYDTEAVRNKWEIDQLMRENKEIFGNKQLTDAQKLARAIKSAERNQDLWEQTLRDAEHGVFNGRKKPAELNNDKLNEIKAWTQALKAEVQELKDLANPKKTKEEIALDAFIARTITREAEYNRRLSVGDFAPTPRFKLELNEAAKQAQEAAGRAKISWEDARYHDRQLNRTQFQKFVDGTVQWSRNAKLLSWHVYPKLVLAGITRVITDPVGRALATPLRVVPGLAEKAPYEMRMDLRSEASNVAAALSSGPQAWKKFRTGISDLDVRGGKRLYDQEMMSFIGNSHGMIKEPFRQGVYRQALEVRAREMEKQGLNPADPVNEAILQSSAVADANRRIFMQDNMISKYFHRQVVGNLKRAGESGVFGTRALANTLEFLMPIVRVSSNIGIYQTQMVTGLPEAFIRLAKAAKRGELDNRAMRLSPEDAAATARAFKLGMGGLILAAYAWNNPERFGGEWDEKGRKKTGLKHGEISTPFGVLPGWLNHTPEGMMLNMTASARRIYDRYVKENPDKKMNAALNTAAFMVMTPVKHMPFVDTWLRIYSTHKDPAQVLSKMAVDAVVPSMLTSTMREGLSPQTALEEVKVVVPGMQDEIKKKKSNH